MSEDVQYTLLMSSLPQHAPDLFSSRLPPLSRIQLDYRLQLLTPSHARDLQLVERLLHWRKMHDYDDATLNATLAAEIADIGDGFARDVVCWRLTLRSLVAALRARQRFGPDYDARQFVWFGDPLTHARRHWSESDLGLGKRYAWLPTVAMLLVSGDSFALEKWLLNVIWRHYADLSNGHYFDFPAVVIYVLRWDIIHRWCTYNAEQALNRFDELVNDALADMPVARP